MRSLTLAPLTAALTLIALPSLAMELAASTVRPPLISWQPPSTWAPGDPGLDAFSRAGVSDAALSDVLNPLPFVAVSACRQYDSRLSTALANNTPRAVTLSGAPCGIPAQAQAVAVNITAFNIAGALSNGVFKTGNVSPPTAAWINYPPAETQRGNAGVVPVDTGAVLYVQVNQGGGSVGFVVDVFGYYAPPTQTQAVAANPLQIALLRWYPANETGATFSVGGFPSGVAFDGANIWVAVQSLNIVTKLRASDGACVAPCTFPVGTIPSGVAFDGTHIWVANNGDGTVTKLRASDGACVGKCTFTVGTQPAGVAFDGANIWVANVGSNNVSKIRASDGFDMGTFGDAGQLPIAVAFDGANIWVTSASGVSKLRAFDGANLGTFSAGLGPIGVAFDGTNIWVANEGSTTITKLRASDGVNLGTFSVGTSPIRVAFDGANIWVVNRSSNNVTKLRASDGANLGTFGAGSNPIGVAFDGANIWVTNSFSGNVSKL